MLTVLFSCGFVIVLVILVGLAAGWFCLCIVWCLLFQFMVGE